MSQSLLLLIGVAIGPALVIAHVMYAVDRREREPLRNIVRYVFLGALAGLLAALLEALVLTRLGKRSGWGPLRLVGAVFLGIALIEEGCKLALLRTAGRRDREINEPFDWVVYAVAVALGFATLENLLYVLHDDHGLRLGVVRALTAVPCHALNGTLMGDRLARAALATGLRRRRLQWLALFEPTLWHGLYDGLALGAGHVQRHHAALAGCLGIALVVLIIAQWVVGVRRVLAHHRASPVCLLPPILYPLPRRVRVRIASPPRASGTAPGPGDAAVPR